MTAKPSGNPQSPSAATDENLLHWLALRLTPGLGNRKAVQLIGVYRTPQAVFRASKSELQSIGISAAVAQSVTSGCAFEDAADQQQKAAHAGVRIIPLSDPAYPPLLKAVFDAPPILFALGRVELLSSVMLGVVGTRRPSAYGTQAATRLSRELSEAGMTIASGMARGIDTAAHKAVLEGNGDTVAVFGSGIDQIYPAENRKLAEQLAKDGLIISEFPMEAPPYPQNFPIRNRIISGISVGIMVVEGSEYSGSAITAKLASEQGREVFAVPGNITSKMSWGPNLLIKQGAKLVQEWNDVAAELEPAVRRRLVDQCRNRLKLQEENSADQPAETNSADFASTSPVPTMARAAQAVLRSLRPDAPTGLDTLVESVEGCSTSEIIAILFDLELAGLVRQLPGKSYIRVWSS